MLRKIASRSQEAVGADGAGVTLTGASGPLAVGCNAFTVSVDEAQYRCGEGPCLSAVELGEVVSSAGLGVGEARWPVFSELVSPLGLRSALSAPLRLDGVVVGSLNLYGRSTDAFEHSGSSVDPVVAAAERSLTGTRLAVGLASLGDLLAGALVDRVDVDTAVGVLMSRYLMGPRAARVLLRQAADLDGVSVPVAARGVLEQRAGS